MYHSLMLLAGMLVLFYSSSLPAVAVIFILAVTAVVLYQSKLRCIRLLASFILAYCWAGGYAVYQQSNNLENVPINQPLRVSGCITDLIIHSANYHRIVIDVSKVSRNGEALGFKGKASLSYYKTGENSYQNGWCGEMIAKLKPVHGHINQRGFDYEAWAYVEKIKALGTLKQLLEIKPGEGVYHRYLQFKSKLVDALSQKLDHRNSFPLLISLALGERDLIENDTWMLLRRTGTSHLLAISGLHIGFVFWMVSLLSTWIWRNLGSLALLISAQKVGWLTGLVFAGGYLLLAGLPLSGRRAWVMLACCVGIWVFDARIEFKQSLIVALWVILLVSPSSVLAIGFWFSYVAVALIVSQFAHFNLRLNPHSGLFAHQKVKKIATLVKIQCLLSIAIIPLNVIYFGEISLISPLANLIAVPLVTLMILPTIFLGTILFAIGLPEISQPLHLFALSLLDGLLGGLALLSKIKGSLTMPVLSHQFCWYLLMIGIFIYQHFRQWPGRWVLCVLFIPLSFNPQAKLQAGEFELNVFDVGQGLAIWFRSADHNMLIDTGYGVDKGFSYFETTIYPVLMAAGVSKLDVLVLSHGDADHAGGLNALLRSELKVDRIYSSKRQAQTLGLYCDDKQAWQWNEISFRFLTSENVAGKNNQSCVLKIHSKYSSVLLPGDIERESELALLRQYKDMLETNLLIVPHHGSSSSSTAHFLHAVNPDTAIVSAGYLNRYGHPTIKIISRYKKAKIALFNTACHGQIRFAVHENDVTYMSLRQKSPPFWRHQCRTGE